MRTKTRKRKGTPLAAAVAVAAVLSAVTISSDQQNRTQSSRTGSAHGLTAFLDPQTGQLREPTPEELIQLQGDRVQAASAPQPIVTETGFSGLALSDDQMTFTVATRGADGKISITHAAGKQDADRLMRAGARGVVAGKEQVLER